MCFLWLIVFVTEKDEQTSSEAEMAQKELNTYVLNFCHICATLSGTVIRPCYVATHSMLVAKMAVQPAASRQSGLGVSETML